MASSSAEISGDVIVPSSPPATQVEDPAGDGRCRMERRPGQPVRDRDVEVSSPSTGAGCVRSRPPDERPFVEDEMRAQQPGARLEEPSEERARDHERWVGDHVVRLAGEAQIGGVGRDDGDTREPTAKLLGPVVVSLHRVTAAPARTSGTVMTPRPAPMSTTTSPRPTCASRTSRRRIADRVRASPIDGAIRRPR